MAWEPETEPEQALSLFPVGIICVKCIRMRMVRLITFLFLLQSLWASNLCLRNSSGNFVETRIFAFSWNITTTSGPNGRLKNGLRRRVRLGFSRICGKTRKNPTTLTNGRPKKRSLRKKSSATRNSAKSGVSSDIPTVSSSDVLESLAHIVLESSMTLLILVSISSWLLLIKLRTNLRIAVLSSLCGIPQMKIRLYCRRARASISSLRTSRVCFTWISTNVAVIHSSEYRTIQLKMLYSFVWWRMWQVVNLVASTISSAMLTSIWISSIKLRNNSHALHTRFHQSAWIQMWRIFWISLGMISSSLAMSTKKVSRVLFPFKWKLFNLFRKTAGENLSCGFLNFSYIVFLY